ncbi:MAG TPA: dTDP-glucose 4,6-dehydratase [Blastocatellia bacterium]
MRVLVTGGAGFIGSNFIRYLLKDDQYRVVNLDKLTYAGNLENLKDVESISRYRFCLGDINKAAEVSAAFAAVESAFDGPPDAVIHFAAESHVDRSIEDPSEFLRTNVTGTQVLLDAARRRAITRFIHVSTDEVYGSLGSEGAFSEQTPLAPNSPYAASKAGSDMLVRAYHKTYRMPAVITRCTNNYGPYQFPEKLIPLMIANALEDKPLPVYGDGLNVRDWIHVEDHCRAIERVLKEGREGEVYNIGGRAERTNLEVVRTILDILGKSESLLSFVPDRPGHDRRYAMDTTKIERELGWRPEARFEEGLEETVRWYLENQEWVSRVRSGEYQKYYDRLYAKRDAWIDSINKVKSKK